MAPNSNLNNESFLQLRRRAFRPFCFAFGQPWDKNHLMITDTSAKANDWPEPPQVQATIARGSDGHK